jgi:predicted glycoside hydrolase/deacetylase ChbG (UPF0249 family)
VGGLLIINADDWGGERAKTAAIARAFAAGAVSSASAMVYMEDSDRAAEEDAVTAMPLGLHLNLTQALSPRAPEAVRSRHERMRSHFGPLRRRRWTLNPRAVPIVRDALADQLERFRALYAREPDHIDGHEHVHVCPDVLLALPPGTRVRSPRTPWPSSRLATSAVIVKRGLLSARGLRTTRRFYSLDDLGPARGDGLEHVLAEARNVSVEVACHPGQAQDDALLESAIWQQEVASFDLGSFADL